MGPPLQVVRVLFGNDLYDVVWLGGFLGRWIFAFLFAVPAFFAHKTPAASNEFGRLASEQLACVAFRVSILPSSQPLFLLIVDRRSGRSTRYMTESIVSHTLHRS